MKIVKHNSRTEWLEWRYTGIGCSEAPAIMNSSKFQTRDVCYALKTQQMIPKPATFQMREGLRLEPLARNVYEKMKGFRVPGVYGESERIEFAIASIDGANFDERIAIEIKCAGKDDHATAAAGKIPKHYIWQCVHILMVSELPKLDYFSYDKKTATGIIVPFKRNMKMENELLAAEKEFWRWVVHGEIPTPKEWTFPVKKTSNKRPDFKSLSFQQRLSNVVQFRGEK